ncbi:MAG: carboxypeptidase-like regulatory domain-containing protein [Vicinamibacterales bacterium]
MTWRALPQRLAGSTILVLLGTIASAQPARPGAAPPATAPPATAQITGVVRSAADEAPVARARVSATTDTGSEPRVTLSGADGKYALTGLPAGSYTVAVTRTGFAPQTYSTGRSITATPIVVAADQAVTADFSLVPAGYISGRILDEDGTPFAGAVVDALVMRTQGGTDVLFSVSTSQTDDRGEFRVFGLAPGQYYVSASDPAFRAVSTPRGILHYSPTYHPGVSFADQARSVVVTGAADAPRVEFRLKIVPPARVAGQLVASDGRQLFSAAIIMSPVEGEGAPIAAPEDPTLLPDGTFSFGSVVPGHYQIRARGQTESAGAALFAVYSLTIEGQDVDSIQMMLRPGGVLDGRLIVESARGTKPPLLPSIRVRAPFIDGNSFGDALTGTVQPNGTFALRGMMKGSHQLVLDGLQPPWVLKSVTFRGSNITDQQFDVLEREQFRDVRVTITDAGSEVSGLVQNAREVAVANTGVLIFPRAPLFWMRTNRRMRVAYTDRNGRFAIGGLPAGEYLAVASHALDESDLGRRDRLTAWEGLATRFVLNSDDARASITLPLVAPPGPAAIR